MVRRFPSATVWAILVLVPLMGGCIGHEEAKPENSATLAAESDVPAPTNVTVEPPQARISVTGTNVTQGNASVESAPGVVTFSGSNSTGSIVSYSWDFGDGTNGTGESVDHEYAGAGIYLILLTVNDDQGLFDNESVNLTILSPAVQGGGSLVLEDPAGDSRVSFGDVLRIEMSDDAAVLTVVMTFTDVQPTAPDLSNVMPSFFLNENRYEPYFSASPEAACSPSSGLYGYTEGGVIEGSTAEIDTDSKSWKVTMPLEKIEAKLPFVVFLETRLSAEPCQFGGRAETVMDRSPDAGTASYPGP